MKMTKKQINKALDSYEPFNCMPDRDILINVLFDLEVSDVILIERDTLSIKTSKLLKLHQAFHIINSLAVNEIIPGCNFRYKLWWD